MALKKDKNIKHETHNFAIYCTVRHLTKSTMQYVIVLWFQVALHIQDKRICKQKQKIEYKSEILLLGSLCVGILYVGDSLID